MRMTAERLTRPSSSRATRSEQFELEFSSSFCGENETIVWVVAAAAEDSRQIIEALHHDEEGNFTSFFVSVFDGAPAFGTNDILAIKAGDEMQLFASQLPAGLTRRELAGRIARALSDPRHVQPHRFEAAEFLLVRLFASLKDERSVHADSALARALVLLQSREGAAPRLVSQMASDILDAMPDTGSLALDGLMRRVKAHALFDVCRTIGMRQDLARSARDLYESAANSFAGAGIAAQARACARSARSLDELILREESPEPTLPGLEPSASDIGRLHMKRPNFRAFRALAVPLAIRLPIALAADQPLIASRLRPVGSIHVPEAVLMCSLQKVSSTNLVPQLKILSAETPSLTKRVRVSIEREHYSLLGIEDRLAREGEDSFGVIVNGDQWEVSAKRATAKLGKPFEFDARALSERAPPLQILVTAGANFGRFEVRP